MIDTQTITQAWSRIIQWRETSRQRRVLGELSDQLLKDIGLSRVDSEREANRPFWDSTAMNDRTLRAR
jgi:uncharacterized protein YjiS (DUF1127 family)